VCCASCVEIGDPVKIRNRYVRKSTPSCCVCSAEDDGALCGRVRNFLAAQRLYRCRRRCSVWRSRPVSLPPEGGPYLPLARWCVEFSPSNSCVRASPTTNRGKFWVAPVSWLLCSLRSLEGSRMPLSALSLSHARPQIKMKSTICWSASCQLGPKINVAKLGQGKSPQNNRYSKWSKLT